MGSAVVIRGCPGAQSPGQLFPVPRPIAFLDRDGVLNVDRGYVATRERFEWTPTAFDSVQLLASMGFVVAVVTNQSGVGRGLYEEDDFLQLTEWMLGEMPEISVVAYCPHEPDANCPGRKPGTGQLEAVSSLFPCLKDRSFLVGDKQSDILAARRFGVLALRADESGPLGAIKAAIDRLSQSENA